MHGVLTTHVSLTVQEEAIPEGLAGNDIVAQAKSGMGKTAVFVVVTLERIVAEDGLQCVVIVHTRELAYQVAKEFERFKAYLEGITVHSVYGGVALAAQEKMLKDDPPHVIVACPGRLKVLIQKKTVDVSRLVPKQVPYTVIRCVPKVVCREVDCDPDCAVDPGCAAEPACGCDE